MGPEAELITCSLNHRVSRLFNMNKPCGENALLEIPLSALGHTGFGNQEPQNQKDVPSFRARTSTLAEPPQSRHHASTKGTRKPLENSSGDLRAPALRCEPICVSVSDTVSQPGHDSAMLGRSRPRACSAPAQPHSQEPKTLHRGTKKLHKSHATRK